MKSILMTAVAACGLLLAAPASAQVKIGVLNDQSGLYADYGGKNSVEAAKMAIEDFGGEVLGQKIEIVTADHQNKPDLGVAIARRWYDAEGVDMITELTTSSVALAVQELSKEKKKIDIVVGAATSPLCGRASKTEHHHTLEKRRLPSSSLERDFCRRRLAWSRATGLEDELDL